MVNNATHFSVEREFNLQSFCSERSVHIPRGSAAKFVSALFPADEGTVWQLKQNLGLPDLYSFMLSVEVPLITKSC